MPNRVVVPRATSLPFSLASFQPEMGRVGRSGQFENLQQSDKPGLGGSVSFLRAATRGPSGALMETAATVPVGVRPVPESTNNGLDISVS